MGADAAVPSGQTLGRRIAVLGAGSMGTMLGACLSREGFPVDLVDVNREHVDALNTNGAAVVGTVTWQVPVHALTPEEMRGTYDVVFLLVKQTHNEVAFAQLRPHLHSRSVVCTLQNGIPEPAVAAVFGVERTLGSAVTWAATYLEPGKVQSTATPDSWHAALGTLDGRITQSAKTVRGILAIMCPAEFVGSMGGIRWSKLLVNASFSGMSAALGCTFGEILDDAEAFRCAQYIARECIQVAEAQGIRMAELSPGLDFKASMDFSSEEERLATQGVYLRLWGSARQAKASMLQDIENGRKSEIDYINGVVSDAGARYQVPTPVNDTVVRVVQAIEAGKMSPCLDNLALFTACL